MLNLFILPFRPKASASAYSTIWTDQGSPLLVHGRELTAKVAARLGPSVAVELAMRYGNPSIPAAIRRLRDGGVHRIVVFPLYPQYASASTGSSLERVFRSASELWNVPDLQVVPPFYDHPAFIEASAELARPVLDEVRPERVFFSFHGVPERHVRKGDPSGRHCLATDDCCEKNVAANRSCYRAHCVRTARSLAARLDVGEDRLRICFQSRLGRDPWLRPYTDHVLEQEAQRGIKRAVILSPAFVADCLETVEELGIRGVESWRQAGGDTLRLVPGLNASEAWADAVVRIAADASGWLRAPGPGVGAVTR